jgi:hypothetical protein
MSDEKDPPKPPVPPVDGSTMPPPPTGSDDSYLTRDLESALDRAVHRLLDRVAASHRIGRRAAVAVVVRMLDALLRKVPPP